MTDIKRTTTYALTGLHCGACVNKVAQALAPLAAEVEVSLQPMQVTLTEATADFQALKVAVENAGQYVLMPHSEPVRFSNTALDQLVLAPKAPLNVADENSSSSWLTTYSPLLLILAYILGASLLVQIGMDDMAGVTTADTMRFFMAGFFLVFSFFKLLDIGAFANAYSAYDLLASRWHGWGVDGTGASANIPPHPLGTRPDGCSQNFEAECAIRISKEANRALCNSESPCRQAYV
jgi:copper chaperone CopZ